MAYHRWYFAFAIGVAGTLACSASPTPSTGSAPSTATRSSRSRDRMDSTEFRRPEFRTMLDAVSRLRPEWLRAVGGPTSARQTPIIGVFVEGDMRGFTVDKLSEFVPEDIKSVRRISPSESVGTYGSSWPWGGIVLTRAR